MKPLLGVLLVLPLTARAEVIYVDYEGAVAYDASADPAHRYSLGDHVAGRLTIDTAVAGISWKTGVSYGDSDATNPFPRTPNFVTGYNAPADELPLGYDSVSVGRDSFFVTDDFFYISARKHDLVDTSTEPSFDITSDEVRGSGEELIAGFNPREVVYGFTLSHLFVHPAECSAPK